MYCAHKGTSYKEVYRSSLMFLYVDGWCRLSGFHLKLIYKKIHRKAFVVNTVLRGLRKLSVLFFVLTTLALMTKPVSSQDERKIELTAQEMIARADRVLDYPLGIIRGRLMHIMPTGKTYKVDITGYIDKSDFLFSFSTADRGEQMKVLFNFGGEEIWVYNTLSTKLFHKTGIDKYEPIVATNFSYVDFSNADFQSNYTAKITGSAVIKEKDTYRLSLTPIFRGGAYGNLTVYVSKDTYLPLRIDFHDTDNVIFKTLSIVEVAMVGSRYFPVRYDMLDIRKGTLTMLTFHGFEENIKFDKKIFFHQTLGK